MVCNLFLAHDRILKTADVNYTSGSMIAWSSNILAVALVEMLAAVARRFRRLDPSRPVSVSKIPSSHLIPKIPSRVAMSEDMNRFIIRDRNRFIKIDQYTLR